MTYEDMVERLRNYFQHKEAVIVAFVFGSSVKGAAGEDSDLDIGVYLSDECEEQVIWSEVSKITQQEVDLVVLNSAPASLISNVLKTGTNLVIKDKNLFLDLYLHKTLEAEDFAGFVQTYWEIYQRSTSLMPEDRTRLIERIQFLQSEFQEIDDLEHVSLSDYEGNKVTRRNLERWAENIINSTIDISKIILASEKKQIPLTYEQALFEFGLFVGMDRACAQCFSSFARLRNILAHEYLDILYSSIRYFIENSVPFYEKVFAFLARYLS